jgi:hypothetical protein
MFKVENLDHRVYFGEVVYFYNSDLHKKKWSHAIKQETIFIILIT